MVGEAGLDIQVIARCYVRTTRLRRISHTRTNRRSRWVYAIRNKRAAAIVAERLAAGESIEMLARDYNAAPDAIQNAIRFELRAA